MATLGCTSKHSSGEADDDAPVHAIEINIRDSLSETDLPPLVAPRHYLLM